MLWKPRANENPLISRSWSAGQLFGLRQLHHSRFPRNYLRVWGEFAWRTNQFFHAMMLASGPKTVVRYRVFALRSIDDRLRCTTASWFGQDKTYGRQKTLRPNNQPANGFALGLPLTCAKTERQSRLRCGVVSMVNVGSERKCQLQFPLPWMACQIETA